MTVLQNSYYLLIISDISLHRGFFSRTKSDWKNKIGELVPDMVGVFDVLVNRSVLCLTLLGGGRS